MEYVQSLGKATDKSWKKIFSKTMVLVNMAQGIAGTEDQTPTALAGPSSNGRTMYVDVDSDSDIDE